MNTTILNAFAFSHFRQEMRSEGNQLTAAGITRLLFDGPVDTSSWNSPGDSDGAGVPSAGPGPGPDEYCTGMVMTVGSAWSVFGGFVGSPGFPPPPPPPPPGLSGVHAPSQTA